MAAFKNQGIGTSGTTVAYGSKVLVIGTKTFVADNVSVTYPSKTIERTNEVDEPSGQVSYATFVTGSAQLQVPVTNGTNYYPALGDSFYMTLNGNGSQFYLTEFGVPESKEAETKIPVGFRKIVS